MISFIASILIVGNCYSSLDPKGPYPVWSVIKILDVNDDFYTYRVWNNTRDTKGWGHITPSKNWPPFKKEEVEKAWPYNISCPK
jgi:hypothetical protein